jgi:hypothetical protein
MDDSLKNRIEHLEKRILSLEWDKNRNQINFSKEGKLQEYKEELAEIKQQVQHG